MTPPTPSTWIPGKPLVMFMVPPQYTMVYAALMTKLVNETVGIGAIELTGVVTDNGGRVTAGLYLISESKIDPISIAGLVLWGETGDYLGFHSSTADECIPTSVIIPDSSASIPTLCMPSIEMSWIQHEERWADAKAAFVKLLTDGRKKRDEVRPYTFITRNSNAWN